MKFRGKNVYFCFWKKKVIWNITITTANTTHHVVAIYLDIRECCFEAGNGSGGGGGGWDKNEEKMRGREEKIIFSKTFE